jgi:superoxide dismutase, Cu-Zn family
VVLAVVLGGALGLGSLGLSHAAGADPQNAQALLRDQAGQAVGVVKLTQEEEGKVLVRAVTHDLTPRFHGFHVHAVGQCVPPFTSAGGHYNPGGIGHGAHAGDMPSLLVGADGTGELRFKTDRFSVAERFDADGSAIIVHASSDNFAHIPSRYHSHTKGTFGPDSVTLATGDAGARVACGVVR